MVDVVGVGTTLVGIISKIVQHCEQRSQNADVVEELHSFLQSLQHQIHQTQEKALVLRNNSALWALDSLKEDLENASLDASNILNKGFVRSLWDANKIQSRLQGLRDRVMTSFQTRLSVAALDVAIEGKQAQDAFQEAMLKVNKELQESCFTTSIALKQGQQVALRKELRQALQPITVALASHTHRIEAAMSLIHSFEPQTSDTEKFFQDVLAALDGLSVKNVDDDDDDGVPNSRAVTHAKRSSGLVKWYEDPVTWEVMCDPVKATDGHTYDRWTLLRNSRHMATSPFERDNPRPFDIAFDDIDVRSRLFHKFPEQESKFRAKRAAYRDAALQEAQLGHFGDSASMLRYVLQWAPRDVECNERLQYVQRRMGAASGKSIASAYHDANLLAREVDHSQPHTGIQSDNTSSSAPPQHLYPSRLDSARSNGHLLWLSPDGLSCRFRSDAAATVKSDNAGAAIADMAVPVRDELRRSTTFFYFEITIKGLLDGNDNVVGLGFTSSESFHDNFLPGCYSSSCGLHIGKQGNIFADGKQVEGRETQSIIARQGDTIGAGIHHGHKEIFFVHNGALIAVMANTISGMVLMPVVALGSPGVHVKVAFNDSAFHPEQRPSRLVTTHPRVSLSPDGLSARYKMEFPPYDTYVFGQYAGASLRADHGACFRHLSQIYYFEVTILKAVAEDGRCGVNVGFAEQDFSRADKCPGKYPTFCTYGGIDGRLQFCGAHPEGQEFGPSFSAGDTIGAGIDHASSTIFFIKNGMKVGHTSRVRMSCALYPVIRLLHCPSGTTAVTMSLNFGQARFSSNTYSRILFSLDTIEQPRKLHKVSRFLSFRWTYKERHVAISDDGLTASYGEPCHIKEQGVVADRAICMSRRSSQVYYFELKVLDRGEFGCIGIGFCNQEYFDRFKLPGSYENSCGYRGNDGKLLVGGQEALEFNSPSFSQKDVVGAGVDYATNTIFFAKNGRLVGDTRHMWISYALCPVIGLGTKNAKVRLNFGQAPFAFDTSQIDLSTRLLK